VGRGGDTPLLRAVFHWINVTGERRLRFNYRANLRFDRANAPTTRETRGETRGSAGDEMDWKNGESEIIVMKLARLPLSAFMGVDMSRGETRRRRRRTFPPCRLLLADRCR
jgi:hypothetical protein